MAETRFSKDHEWVRLDGAIATIGITNHAQEALGDIVFVEVPEAGREVATGEACAVVESVKAASDIYAPLPGKVTENNGALADDPGLVNRAAETDAWFFRLQVSDRNAFDTLMDEAEYRRFADSL